MKFKEHLKNKKPGISMNHKATLHFLKQLNLNTKAWKTVSQSQYEKKLLIFHTVC